MDSTLPDRAGWSHSRALTTSPLKPPPRGFAPSAWDHHGQACHRCHSKTADREGAPQGVAGLPGGPVLPAGTRSMGRSARIASRVTTASPVLLAAQISAPLGARRRPGTGAVV
jgi:hypothetical protein